MFKLHLKCSTPQRITLEASYTKTISQVPNSALPLAISKHDLPKENNHIAKQRIDINVCEVIQIQNNRWVPNKVAQACSTYYVSVFIYIYMYIKIKGALTWCHVSMSLPVSTKSAPWDVRALCIYIPDIQFIDTILHQLRWISQWISDALDHLTHLK